MEALESMKSEREEAETNVRDHTSRERDLHVKTSSFFCGKWPAQKHTVEN